MWSNRSAGPEKTGSKLTRTKTVLRNLWAKVTNTARGDTQSTWSVPLGLQRPTLSHYHWKWAPFGASHLTSWASVFWSHHLDAVQCRMVLLPQVTELATLLPLWTPSPQSSHSDNPLRPVFPRGEKSAILVFSVLIPTTFFTQMEGINFYPRVLQWLLWCFLLWYFSCPN